MSEISHLISEVITNFYQHTVTILTIAQSSNITFSRTWMVVWFLVQGLCESATWVSFVSYLLGWRRDSDDEQVEASTTTDQVNHTNVSIERQTEYYLKIQLQ